MRWKLALAFVLLLFLAVGALGWWQRMPLLAWYTVRCLATATDADRETWVNRVVALGDEALPALVRCLRRPDAQACANAQTALSQLAGPAEKRCSAAAVRLTDAFTSLSTAGQTTVLDLLTEWLRHPPERSPRTLVSSAVRLLPLSARSPEPQVRGRALGLAALVLARECTADERNACRELVRVTLEDPEAANRIDAIRMASTPSLTMWRQVAPLLKDPVAEVRQAAMAVVGCAPEAVATDDLLHSLHDSDPDVRRLCEAALRGRGLRNEDVTLGRLITDARAGVRLQVLERLSRADLEPGLWLRRLSQDSAPAVRAAAIRVAYEARLDLGGQLEKMSQSDPSPTVRQLAQHYLSRQKCYPPTSSRPGIGSRQ